MIKSSVVDFSMLKPRGRGGAGAAEPGGAAADGRGGPRAPRGARDPGAPPPPILLPLPVALPYSLPRERSPPPPYCCPYPSPYRTHSLANAAPPPYCCPYPSPYRTHSLADAGAGGAEEGGIDALTRAAQRVPELTERKRLLDMHTNICTVNPPPRLAHKHLHGEPPSPAVATPRPLAV